MRTAAIIAFAAASLAAFAFLCTALLPSTVPPALLALCALFVAWPAFSLNSALKVFILLLPFFGNRPGSSQAFYLLLLGSALQLGLLLSMLRPAYRSYWQCFPGQHSIFFVAYLLFLAGVFSLSGLPLVEYCHSWRSSLPAWHDFSALLHRVLVFAQSSEEKIDYSVLSVIWTALSLNLALAVFISARRDARQIAAYALMLLVGLAISLIAGVLDYYQAIDLRAWRSLDPVVNPGDVQFRLQSFFGHSGWFAEYVTLCIPYAMLILLFRIRFSLRVVLILALLLLGEFVLILTFQRGGWLSYPLTLFAVWAAIYLCRAAERNSQRLAPALKKSLLKITLSLPLTLLLSTVLLYSLNHLALLPSGVEFRLTRYIERVKDIQRTSDRSSFVKAGFMLARLNPFMGGGSESFAWHFRREFNDPHGRYYKRLDLPLHGSAHNVYLQTLAGKGLAGLTLLLLLVAGMVLKAAKHALTDGQGEYKAKVILMMGAACGVAFLIYGNVQEVFYVQSLQYIFFVSLALTGAAAPLAFEFNAKTRRRLWGLIGLMLLGDIAWKAAFSFHDAASAGYPRAYGCYQPERDPSGRLFRWCGVRAGQYFKVLDYAQAPKAASGPDDLRHGQAVLVEIQMGNSGFAPQTVTLQIRFSGQLIYELPVSPLTDYRLLLPISGGFPPHLQEQMAFLEFRTASYFIPRRDTPPSQDKRVLSFRLF